MKTKRTLTIAAVLVALAALMTLGILRGTRQVQAQDQQPPPAGERISFGMVGITQGQTMRVNVSNVVAQNDSNLPPGPVRVAIIVVNSHGDPFRNRDGNPIRRVVMLERGESAFLDLNADDIQLPPGPVRLQLRAIVNAHPPYLRDSNEVPPPTDGRIVTSVEVFNNNNGRTVFAVTAPPSVQKLQPPAQPE
jgi:hypothetical protein